MFDVKAVKNYAEKRLTKQPKLFVLETPTADVVEVVRCKNCAWRGENGCPMYFEEYVTFDDDGYSDLDIVTYDRTTDNGFCDRGERKSNEND